MIAVPFSFFVRASTYDRNCQTILHGCNVITQSNKKKLFTGKRGVGDYLSYDSALVYAWITQLYVSVSGFI